MNKLLAGLLAAQLFAAPAFADSTINGLGAGAAVQSTDIFPAYQGANPATGPTAAQIKTFVNTGQVASVTGSCGVTVSPTTGATIVSAPVADVPVSSTTDTIANTQCNTVRRYTNSAAVTVTVPSPSGFPAGFVISIKSDGANTAGTTVTPGTTIDGSASNIPLKTGQSLDIYLNASSLWTTLPGRATNVACADLTNSTVLCSTAPGTGVATAVAAALSSAGGLTTTVFTGTVALGTTLISSASCNLVTLSITGLLTSDVLLAGWSSNPIATTGYIPATAGMLTILAWPSAGQGNFEICNNTSSSVTPGASLTLNVKVVR